MAWEILLIYAAVLVIVASFPLLLDLVLAYRERAAMANHLSTLLQGASVDVQRQEFGEFLKGIEAPPSGVPGLARATIALSVLAILGLATFHILIFGLPAGDATPLDNVLSVLGGLVAAVTGFYFGGKAAEKRSETPPSGDGGGGA